MNKTNKILLTGQPGCGKTTVVMAIVKELNHRNAAGFYTKEIRHDEIRTGFSWVRLDGATGTLAHIDITGRFKVGKYGVDVAGFEKEIIPILDVQKSDTRLFVIDEIGKMECLSEKFAAAVRRLFVSDKTVLATVAKRGGGLINEVKKYPDVKLFQLKRGSQEKIIAEIMNLISPFCE
jgi:nucleoside-triphosphatase